MTVAELIAALGSMPQDAEVRVRWENSCGSHEHNGLMNPRVDRMMAYRSPHNGAVFFEFVADDDHVSDFFERLGVRDVVVIDEAEP